jgi:hypothetical protein
MVTGVDVKLWGNTLLISCLYAPLSDRRPFQLVFSDTREITWHVHDTNALEECTSDLTGFILGEGGHSKPAIITTDIFELHVLYDGLFLETLEESTEIVAPHLSDNRKPGFIKEA